MNGIAQTYALLSSAKVHRMHVIKGGIGFKNEYSVFIKLALEKIHDLSSIILYI